MSNKESSFIKQTQEFWSSPVNYNREISESEAVEIIENTQEFFGILLRIKRRTEAQKQLNADKK